MSGKGTAVVVEVAWVNGLAAIRSLGRRGLRVLALDHEEGFVAAMRALAEETDDLLPVFPTHDEHVNAIARHADVLADRYRFPFPSWEVLERIQSKRHQLETAESVGVPVPRTLYPR